MITIPYRITREFVRQHPDWIFIYSADVVRKGFFGQMNHLHGEPNCYPVSVRYSGCKSSGYFNDSNIEHICAVHRDIDAIPIESGKITIVLPKIGEGASQMKWFAPKLFSYLRSKLDTIQTKDIRINYNA